MSECAESQPFFKIVSKLILRQIKQAQLYQNMPAWKCRNQGPELQKKSVIFGVFNVRIWHVTK